MVRKYALINSENVCVNVLMWDGETLYNVPDGYVLLPSDDINIGDVVEPVDE